MTHDDNVFRMLVEANPIPEIEELDLIDVGGSRYLATLEQRSSEVTQTDTRRDAPKKNPRGGLILGVAASVAVILTATAIFLASNDNDEFVATTVTTVNDRVELQGQGNENSHSFRLDGGSYSVETTVSGDCSYRFELNRSGTGHMVETITSMDGAGTTTVVLDEVPADFYIVNVDTDTAFSCPWSQIFTRP